MIHEIIDLPRDAWRAVPPSRLQIALAAATIVLAALVWAVT